ncbi:hypothetical protein [Micromonospora sp. LOL_023]|uniref:hypothetical protein n=1 Tax=Micromonospora sp. LOL_023 TaxID=3345418 RepID=UPI003A8962ED
MPAWDIRAGRRQVRTAAPNGVSARDIEPDGRHLLEVRGGPDRTGVGVWRRQPVDPGQTAIGQGAADRATAGPPPLALTGLPPGRQHGIAFDATGRRTAVCVGTGRQTRCYAGEPGGPGHLVAVSAGYTALVDLAADGNTIALAARADATTAVSVVRLTDGRTDTVAGSDQQRIWSLEFHPGNRPGRSIWSPSGS